MPNRYKRYLLTVSCLCLFLLLGLEMPVLAQTGSIQGKINTHASQAAGFATVVIKETQQGTTATENGTYILKKVKAGNYLIQVSLLGFETQEKTVAVSAGKVTTLDFTLTEIDNKLNQVEITAKRSLNEQPVSIGKIALRPMDLPQSIAVVGSEFIARQQASKLSDVIKNVNGVSLGTTRGATSETFFARGYNLGANNIMKNGARSNSAVIPEASTLEKVEVLKGSAALLYGNVSGGAVINLVTKQPKFEFGGEVAMRAGSYNLYKPIVDVYGPVSKKIAFRVIGTFETAESYRKSVESERFYVNPSLLYKLGNKTEILVQGDYLKNDFTPDFGIGTLDNKIPVSISRSAFFNAPWAYNKIAQTTTSVNVNHRLSQNWKVNFIASQQLFNRNYFSTERIQADADGDWGRKITRSDISETYYTSQLNFTGTFKTGSVNHDLLVGTDAEQYLNTSHTFKIESLGKDGVYDSINILNAGKFTPRTDEPISKAIIRIETPTYRLGYYAQDLISISDKFKVLTGLRWSYQKTAKTKNFDLEKNEEKTAADSKYDRAFSPRLGIVFQPVASTSVFASYSNNFAPNTGKDISGSNLKPSIIDQYEAGIKNDLIKGKLTANFTVYRIINNDLALQAQFKADGVTLNTDATIKEFAGQTTSDGAELDLASKLFENLDIMAGYSYNFMRYTKTSGAKGSYLTGERLVSNPAHTANASIFYTFKTTVLNGLKVGASGFYTGARNAGWNNTVGQAQQYSRLIPVAGFTTFDVSLGYGYKNISVLGKISNLTNELNYLVHENYSVNPIPPRQFVTTLSYKF